jgi:dCMP deaminase
MRPDFDDIYMLLALMIAQRSTCRRSQVGCVIVTQDNQQVLAIGYNGGPKGLWNDCLSDEPGKCGHLHAEVNALIKSNYSYASPKKAYVTTSPCLACATAIINGGIQEVVYHTRYRDDSGLRLLEEGGVKVRQHVPTWHPPRSVPE